ncbi:MAG TPA: DUF167 domain-containing protein [Polyangia bacterium]|nr:DUF167 domain-containing protein [Polyangia bacterium]
MTDAIRQAEDGLLLEVQVVPRASRERIGPVIGGRIKVQLTAPPVDGAANEALVALLARALDVPRRQVRIVRGERGRKKTVHVAGAQQGALLALLEETQ